MKRKGWGLAAILCACVTMLLVWGAPAQAWAAEGDVAKIGDATYTTLDEAVEKAKEGSTIELLQDCELTKGFNKTLTFTGGHKITVNKQLTSDGEGWMCFGLHDPNRVLTFDGVEVEWNSEVGTAPWLMLSLSGTMNVTNGAKVVFTVDSGSTGSRNAIYMNAGSSINVTNGSTFEIYGYSTAGKEGQGLQLDKTGEATVNVFGKSTFLIDGTNRGYVNSPTINVDNSTFTVQNCTANASNGGIFNATNGSTVTYRNNTGHGLSAGSVSLTNGSTLTADHNGYYGVCTSGGFTVDGTSTLTVTGNSKGGDFAGLKLTSGVTAGHVEAGATVTITDNYCSGLSNNGTVVFDEGAHLTITGNLNDKGTSSRGGGIYNSGDLANLTLPSGAVIYNNHAKTDGDDIFNNTTATITFPQVGSGWKLDGVGIDKAADDCTDSIDGWYDDSADVRWEAHAESYDGIHAKEYTFNGATTKVTGPLALKAAHGLGVVTVKPADITVYMGGSEGYEGTATEEGKIEGSNSMPEPGFYLTLSKDINDALQAAGVTDVDSESADLSKYLSIYTHDYDGGELHWKLENYGANYSGANGHHIYRIVPDPEPGQKAVPVRLQFTDAQGNTYTSDDFDPASAGALNQQYTMKLYTALVDAGQVVFEVDVPNADGTFDKYYNGMTLNEGTLNIRYVTGNQDDVVTGLASSEDEVAEQVKKNPGKAYAFTPEGTKYTINDSQVDVTDSAAPSLLFDNVVSDHTTEGAAAYDQQLALRTVDVAADAGTTFTKPQYEAKYLDLVDANNANVWLKADQPVTVYWPYPAGTDENTEFTLVHFEGLNREMGNDEVSDKIDAANAHTVDVENTPYGVKFTTNGFSPFVLMWETAEDEEPTPEPPTPVLPETPETPETPADDQSDKSEEKSEAGLPSTGDVSAVAGIVAAAGVAVLGGAAALRKRRE